MKTVLFFLEAAINVSTASFSFPANDLLVNNNVTCSFRDLLTTTVIKNKHFSSKYFIVQNYFETKTSFSFQGLLKWKS